MPEREIPTTSSVQSASASSSWRVKVCRSLWRTFLFVWGTLIANILAGTLANLNTTTTDTPLTKLYLVHIALSYPWPTAASLGAFVLLTLLSWVGRKDRHMTTPHGLSDRNLTTIQSPPQSPVIVPLQFSSAVNTQNSDKSFDRGLLGSYSRFGIMSSNEKHIASITSNKNKIYIWNIKTGKTLSTLQDDKGRIHWMLWSPSGKSLAAIYTLSDWKGDHYYLGVWDTATGKLVFKHRLEDDINNVWSIIAWSPSGHWLALRASSDSYGNKIDIYDGVVGTYQTTYWLPPNPTWNLSSRIKANLEPERWAIAWSPNGRLLASSHIKWLYVLDVATGEIVHSYKAHDAWIFAIAWSPDGQLLASGSGDKVIRAWEVASGREVHCYKGHAGTITTMAWSPDGQLLASGSHDKTVRVWRVTDEQPIFTYHGHSTSILSVSWTSDGQCIISSARDATHIWQAL